MTCPEICIFLGVTSRSQLSSTKTAEESQKNHWTIFQLVKGEKWPPCPEWKPRSSSDVSWVKLGWKKHRRAAVPVVKFFINTLLASGKKNVKHPRSQRTSKWHLNFKIYKKKSELSEVWDFFGPYRLIVLSWPLVPVAPLLRIPQGHTLLWALLAIPPVLFLDGSSPRWHATKGAMQWVTHIDIQGTYRLSWWSIYI
jgi:hypothetical protein